MKYLIVSDIHGSWPRLQQVLRHYREMQCDMLAVLGDILNYGPRNGVPDGLDAPAIVQALNALAPQIVAVRGNCDSEVDQMLLQFPIMADYILLVEGGKRLFLTHGHIYNESRMPTLGIDALVFGHTHMQKLERRGSLAICNTGSITFPKGGNPPTFATLSEGSLRIHLLDGAVLKEMKI